MWAYPIGVECIQKLRRVSLCCHRAVTSYLLITAGPTSLDGKQYSTYRCVRIQRTAAVVSWSKRGEESMYSMEEITPNAHAGNNSNRAEEEKESSRLGKCRQQLGSNFPPPTPLSFLLIFLGEKLATICKKPLFPSVNSCSMLLWEKIVKFGRTFQPCSVEVDAWYIFYACERIGENHTIKHW